MAKNLPDGGAKLVAQRQQILERMAKLKRPVPVIDSTGPQGGGIPKVKLQLERYFNREVPHCIYARTWLMYLYRHSSTNLCIMPTLCS